MQAFSLPQAFEPAPPMMEVNRQQRAFRPRPPLPVRQLDEGYLTISKLSERLALLARLELPCTITIASPALRLSNSVIRRVEFSGDSLTISGKDFNLRLLEPNIHSIRLVSQRETGDGLARLDIHHSQGMLYASIKPTADGNSGEVWQDVMENPSLSLI